MNKISRKEKKFLISIDNYYKYSNYISKILVEDSNNGDNGYTIRSLYFDSLDDRDFEEKKSGVELRRKIRLRLYNPDDNYAILEMKQKQGDNRLKRSLKISKADANSLIHGQYNVLLNYNEEFSLECYGVMNMYCYRPKIIVEYERKAFIAKGNSIRVSFDKNIVATESNFNIFDKNLSMYPVMDKYNVILEVKYNNFLLSYIKDALNLVNQSEISVSKYILARNVGKNANIKM